MPESRRQQVLDCLRQFESPNVTYLPSDSQWPMVWNRARGMEVWDVEGNTFMDFTAAFGVAAAGHAAPAVVRAGRAQMGCLLHAMGDVHPHPLKGELARRLSDLTFGRWTESGVKTHGKVVFCNSGFESIEVALKTACQATGRDRVLGFSGAYHGLGYGALVTTHRSHFRGRFGQQLAHFADWVDFPEAEDALARVRSCLEERLMRGGYGAILVEPVQGRGGIRVPPPGFLSLLRELCDAHGTLLIVDEVFTGFGRTGKWFACEHDRVVPDLICLGKALTGGFPLSAMVGEAALMDRAWPKSSGEAIHTSTYLGHPVGCAMALAQLEILERRRLVERSRRMGEYCLRSLRESRLGDQSGVSLRGRGLMVGIEFRDHQCQPDSRLSLQLLEDLLEQGYIVLPDGDQGQVIGLTPPLIVSKSQISSFVCVLEELYQRAIAS